MSISVFAMFFLASCSLYRSDGRKNFESESKSVITTQDYKPILCDEISSLTYWYETRFPSPQSEWVESSTRLEVWQDHLDDSHVQLRTYENHVQDGQQIPTVTRCLATFSSLEEWYRNRAFYLKSLEGEQP